MTVQIRISGTPEEVRDAVRRQERVCTVIGKSNPRPSRKKPGEVLVYLEADFEQH